MKRLCGGEAGGEASVDACGVAVECRGGGRAAGGGRRRESERRLSGREAGRGGSDGGCLDGGGGDWSLGGMSAGAGGERLLI